MRACGKLQKSADYSRAGTGTDTGTGTGTGTSIGTSIGIASTSGLGPNVRKRTVVQGDLLAQSQLATISAHEYQLYAQRK